MTPPSPPPPPPAAPEETGNWTVYKMRKKKMIIIKVNYNNHKNLPESFEAIFKKLYNFDNFSN